MFNNNYFGLHTAVSELLAELRWESVR